MAALNSCCTSETCAQPPTPSDEQINQFTGIQRRCLITRWFFSTLNGNGNSRLGCAQKCGRVCWKKNKKKRKLKMCRIPRIRVREIVLLTEIKKDDAAQKARMIFFFSQVGKKAADKYRRDRNKRAILACTQKLEASAAFL